MITESQKKKFTEKVTEYKKRYINKQIMQLDESSTRIMINYFLVDVLGYAELKDIKTEFRIADKYADYVIQLRKKKHFIVEVKAINLDLTEKHFRQALEYAANEGIDWILVTNGRQFKFYRVIFKKPISSKKIFDIDFQVQNTKKIADSLVLLSKDSVEKGHLMEYWKHFEVLDPQHLSKFLYSKNMVSTLKKSLKQKHGIKFTDDDLLESMHAIITNEIDSEKPNAPTE